MSGLDNAPRWRKSSRSQGNGSNCIEVANAANAILVRDSKDPAGPCLTFTRNEWSRFIAEANAKRFDFKSKVR